MQHINSIMAGKYILAKVSNRFWFQLHGWFSLPIWIIFCLVCLTGTIAVFSHELTWLTNPNARAENPQDLPTKTMPELISIVEHKYPTAKVVTALNFEPYLVNVIIFTDRDKPYAVAYVNQYTGAVQEVNDGFTFINFMRSFHAWLLFPWHHNYSVGYYLVSAMAIVMLGALITGLIVYKQFWRSFLNLKIRINQGKKTFLSDLHRLSGVWSIWFMLLMSITGLWYLIQAIFWHTDVEIDPPEPMIPISAIPIATDDKPNFNYSLQDALLIAKQQFPDFRTTYILPAEHNRDNHKLYGTGDFIFYDQYSYSVIVNPWNGEIEQVRAPENMTLKQTFAHIAHPLHYGTIGGIWTKIIWFIFGLILTGMSITGFMMWSARTFKWCKSSQILEATQEAMK